VRMSVCGQMGRSFANGADYELVVWTKKNRSHIRASYQGTISFRTGGFNEPYARAGPDFMTQMYGLPYSTGEAMEVCTFVYVHVCTFDPCRRQVRTYAHRRLPRQPHRLVASEAGLRPCEPDTLGLLTGARSHPMKWAELTSTKPGLQCHKSVRLLGQAPVGIRTYAPGAGTGRMGKCVRM